MPEVTHKFKVGDKVVYTNDYGVCFGVKTISVQDTRTYDLWGKDKTIPVYLYEGIDTPWCGIKEERFVLADVEDLIMDAWGFDQKALFFQQKYGRPTTRAEREALLDTDPFEGELTA